MILVTGATGLVGAHLTAQLLLKNQEIKALFRTEEKKNITKNILSYYAGKQTEALFEKIVWVQADITDIPALEKAFLGIEKVYHCAGHISEDSKNYKKLQKINIEGTANIVNMCLAFQVKKLCHVSSIASLGKAIGKEKITEEDYFEHDRHQSSYALTKHGGEMEVWRGSQEGLPVVIVNPGVIIGAGSWQSGSGLLFSKTHKGFSYVFPKTTGFVTVEDVVKAMLLLMESSIQNERFILVAENWSFTKLLSEIAVALKKPIPSKKLKPWMVRLGWIVQATGSLLFGTKQQIKKRDSRSLFTSSFYDNSKLKTAIDFQFTPIKKGIAQTAKLYLRSI